MSGAEGTRTPDLLDANQALSQLSYNPGKLPPYNALARSVQAPGLQILLVQAEEVADLVEEGDAQLV